MNLKIRLKPCPFCGGEAFHRYHIFPVRDEKGDEINYEHIDTVVCANYKVNNLGQMVGCKKGHIMLITCGLYGNCGQAISAWNKMEK